MYTRYFARFFAGGAVTEGHQGRNGTRKARRLLQSFQDRVAEDRAAETRARSHSNADKLQPNGLTAQKPLPDFNPFSAMSQRTESPFLEATRRHLGHDQRPFFSNVAAEIGEGDKGTSRKLQTPGTRRRSERLKRKARISRTPSPAALLERAPQPPNDVTVVEIEDGELLEARPAALGTKDNPVVIDDDLPVASPPAEPTPRVVQRSRIPPRPSRLLGDAPQYSNDDGLVLYCDGSWLHNRYGGCGVSHFRHGTWSGISVTLGAISCSTEAEMHGVYSAYRLARRLLRPGQQKVLILSDLVNVWTGVVKASNSRDRKNPHLQVARQIMHEHDRMLEIGVHVQVGWVKGTYNHWQKAPHSPRQSHKPQMLCCPCNPL